MVGGGVKGGEGGGGHVSQDAQQHQAGGRAGGWAGGQADTCRRACACGRAPCSCSPPCSTASAGTLAPARMGWWCVWVCMCGMLKGGEGGGVASAAGGGTLRQPRAREDHSPSPHPTLPPTPTHTNPCIPPPPFTPLPSRAAGSHLLPVCAPAAHPRTHAHAGGAQLPNPQRQVQRSGESVVGG